MKAEEELDGESMGSIGGVSRPMNELLDARRAAIALDKRRIALLWVPMLPDPILVAVMLTSALSIGPASDSDEGATLAVQL
jgi:hypothetical protein